jgi:LPS sulfotransferase NodH
MARKTKFMVIGVARSGTTWLADLLHSHPDILCMKEPFHHSWQGRRKRHSEFWYDNDYFYGKADRKQGNNKGTYVRTRKYLKDKVWALPGPIVGWKALFANMRHYPELGGYFEKMGDELHTILITRNPIRVYLSSFHARQTSQWEAHRGKQIKPRDPVALDVNAVVDAIERVEQDNLDAHCWCSNILHVDYGQLCVNHYETMGGILDFLRARHNACAADTLKLQPGDIRDHVMNWDEVVEQLPEKYKHYAEEDEIL